MDNMGLPSDERPSSSLVVDAVVIFGTCCRLCDRRVVFKYMLSFRPLDSLICSLECVEHCALYGCKSSLQHCRGQCTLPAEGTRSLVVQLFSWKKELLFVFLCSRLMTNWPLCWRRKNRERFVCMPLVAVDLSSADGSANDTAHQDKHQEWLLTNRNIKFFSPNLKRNSRALHACVCIASSAQLVFREQICAPK